MGFRADINGLRAIAVLCVVLYHYGVPGFGGGFVGVDVFFVISGFLMTHAVLSKVDRGEFSLWGFYAARARRIVPALLAMNLVLLAIGFLWMLPSEYGRLGKSVLTSSTFVSNIGFWQEQGYFDAPSQQKMLLHTWSLSVEWQFYLVFPLFLLALKRIARGRHLLHGVVLVALVSLLLSILVTPRKPEAAFFLLPTRAWEMLVGTLVYLGRERVRAPFGLVVGCAAIALATYGYDDTLRYPGHFAILPVLGSAVLISARSKSAWLDNPVAQFLGNVSYSLYLAHWPLIVWFRRGDQPPEATTVAWIMGASVLLAYASYRWVETPLRRVRPDAPKARAFAAYMLATAVFAGAGGVVMAQGGLAFRVPPLVAKNDAASEDSGLPEVCPLLDGYCQIGPPRPRKILVWGDSHAEHLYAALAQAIERGGFGDRQVLLAVGHGCPPVRGLGLIYQPDKCPGIYERAYARATRDDVDAVVVASIWTPYFRERVYDFDSGPNVCIVEDGGCQGALDMQAGLAFLEDQLKADLGRLVELGKRVVLVLPVPAQPYHVPHALARQAWKGEAPEPPLSRAQHDLAQGEMAAALRRVAAAVGAGLVDPTSILCGPERCDNALEGVSIYRDNNHLTAVGARLLAPSLADALSP